MSNGKHMVDINMKNYSISSNHNVVLPLMPTKYTGKTEINNGAISIMGVPVTEVSVVKYGFGTERIVFVSATPVDGSKHLSLFLGCLVNGEVKIFDGEILASTPLHEGADLNVASRFLVNIAMSKIKPIIWD